MNNAMVIDISSFASGDFILFGGISMPLSLMDAKIYSIVTLKNGMSLIKDK